MKTRNIITALFLLFIGNVAFAQENYLWPVEGEKAGESILYSPPVLYREGAEREQPYCRDTAEYQYLGSCGRYHRLVQLFASVGYELQH